MLRFLKPQDTEKVLRDFHDGLEAGNYVGDKTAHKVMRASYYWPTLFKDTHAYARKFPSCQRCVDRD